MAIDPASSFMLLLLILGLPVLMIVGAVLLFRGSKASQEGEFDPEVGPAEQRRPVHHVVGNEPRRTERTTD